MPFFMNPLAFYAAATLLVVAGVYLFRRQSRDVRVSTLMFFSAVKVAAEGGRRVTRPQTPLILLVELLILILVVLAAADPRAIIGEEFMPLVIILDDSYSMSQGKSAKDRAINFLENEIFARRVYRISLIRAGVKPEFIGRRDMLPVEAAQLIENWRCRSALANLDEAVKLAGESFNQGTRVLVLTDSRPESTLSENISWYAFGEPVNNLAVTSASRYALGNVDRCFVEFSNFSNESADLQAEIVETDSGRLIEKVQYQMAANSVRRLRFSLKNNAATVKVKILSDPVEFDNEVWLMPVRKKPLRVSTATLPQPLRRLIENTVIAAENAELSEINPELIFTTDAQMTTLPDPDVGIFYFPVASQPMLVRGAVTSDRIHEVCEGLPEARGIWAIEADAGISGYPLLTVADKILLALGPAPQQRMQMNLVPEYSTIQRTSFWPVLFWNVFAWRQSLKPGPVDFNYRSGMEVVINSGRQAEIELTLPSGKSEKLQSWRGQSFLTVDEVGLYQLSTGTASWTVAVNLLSPQESNLTTRSSIQPDEPAHDRELLKHSSDVRWWFIIPALLLLLLHQWLVSRRRVNLVY